MAGDAIFAAASAAAGYVCRNRNFLFLICTDKAVQAGKLAMQHPIAATCIGTGIAVVAAPAVVTAPILATAGFGANGVVAGEFRYHIHVLPV